MAYTPPSNLVKRWEREVMTLTGWNCQQGHEHMEASEALRCNDAYRVIDEIARDCARLQAENEALRAKLGKVGEYVFASIMAHERGDTVTMSFDEWLASPEPQQVTA